LPGTTTSTSIAIAAAGTSPQTSITANAEGKWEVSGNEILPYIDKKHKWGIFANATDATANTPFYMGPFDNVEQSANFTQVNQSFDTVALMDASTTPSVGNIVFTAGYTTAGDGGDNYYEIVAAATGTDDGGSFIDLAGSGHQAKALFPGGIVRLEQFNVNDRDSLNNVIQYSNTSGLEVTSLADFSTSFTMATGETINLPAFFKLNLLKGAITITADGTFFDAAATIRMIYGASATSISNSSLSGIKVIGGLTDFTNDGFGKDGILIEGATDTDVFNCEAETVERGIFVRNGSSGCNVHHNVAHNCFEQGVGLYGTSGSPIESCKLHNNYAYCDTGLVSVRRMSGIRTEEVYDSEIYENRGTQCAPGIRIEQTRDSIIRDNKGWENLQEGIAFYAGNERNNFYGNRAWDNNLANNDDVNLTDNKSNANVKFSGISVEALSYNNNITNNTAFQTNATTIPFNSGSDEPVLGSLLQGVTSSETGRVRRIVIDSGTWGGGDAAGTLHIVGASGSFNAAEVIQNITTSLTYNTGGTQPRIGDTLQGATSSATGVVLWISQTSGDWGTSDSAGTIYLTSAGSFTTTELLNNTTTSDNSVATVGSTIVPVDADIATTNGATTIGTSLGFQKYGIGVNPANRTGVGTAPSYNTITSNQCFNNDLGQLEDRGFYNITDNNNTFSVQITRSI
jgi:hypothetical protein